MSEFNGLHPTDPCPETVPLESETSSWRGQILDEFATEP